MVTVFAGVDSDAVNQARKYTLPYPPSSPSIGLFKDGTLVHFIERHHIEGRSAEMIAENLATAYDEFC
jgi:putative YphP/YqiW family bacilliredoxin